MSAQVKPKIVTGRRKPPARILFYGQEGSGKSNFGRQFPKPIFIDVDRSTDEMDVARIGDWYDPGNPPPRDYAELLAVIRLLRDDAEFRGDRKTLVLDTADKIEQDYVWPETVRRWKTEGGKAKPATIHEIGFNKGFPAALGVWSELLAELDSLQMATRMNVVILAHASTKKVTNLAGEDYTTYEPALYTGNNASSAELLREWAAAVLFVCHDDKAQKQADVGFKKVGKGWNNGKRLIYTVHQGWCMAKNRTALPAKLEYPFETDTDTLAWEMYSKYVDEFYSGAWLLRDVDPAELKSAIGDMVTEVQCWKETAKDWSEKTFGPHLAAAGDDAEALKRLYAQLNEKITRRGAVRSATAPNDPAPPTAAQTNASVSTESSGTAAPATPSAAPAAGNGQPANEPLTAPRTPA